MRLISLLSFGLARCRFFLRSHGGPRHLHSFPTRRSSDLVSPRQRVLFIVKSLTPSLSLAALDDDRIVVVARSTVIWERQIDRKSTRLNSSHVETSYAVFCLKKTKAA